MSTPHSDALVFFGATGDLVYKRIFPALYAMERRGHLHVPVIAVARSEWTIEQFRTRARKSVERHDGFDEAVFAKLQERLHYISGNYGAPATHAALRKVLGGAAHPLHYLAIPPSVFARVVEGLGQSGCVRGARVLVEKPFECGLLAKELIAQTCERQGISPSTLTFHADNGSAMVSQPVAFLLASLGITKSHSRPHVSDDNPFSEAHFKTLKYSPDFPERFASLEHARGRRRAAGVGGGGFGGGGSFGGGGATGKW